MPWDQGPGLRCPGALVPGFPSKIEAVIEVSQCCALCQHSCKPRYPPVLQAFALIVAEIKRHQRCALRQNS